jgi:ribosomal protein S12 methylthiotransferase
VLVDEVDPDGAVGRSALTRRRSTGACSWTVCHDLQPGDLVRAVVTRSDAYDLWAEPLAR